MKKIVLFILVGLMTGILFAQEPGAAEKNAANDALRKKDYVTAFTNLEKYLQINEYKDKAAIYNAAFAANKSKNYTAAEKYFDMSIKNNYKLGSSYLGKAQAEEELKKESAMLSTLEEGLKAVPGNAKLENKYGTYFMKKGQEAQKANKLEEAVENYTKVSALTTKAQKVQALTALSQLYYNDGAGILQKAASFANSDKEKYAAEEKKAQAAFKKAEEYVGQLQATDAENPIAKELAKQIKSVLK
ncbi:hypothetical protein [Odoribacter lunatus]|uniref:hypothetical protein n=1 Tax=Odoribacter lunatus TaxID=2941335 RepID=UPI00204186A8|nr:hypothetical protein [Odoribacter lunatus]